MHTLPRGNRTARPAENTRGMTLIELTIGMSVLGICSVLTVGSIVGTYEVINSVSNIRERYEEGQNALKRIAAEMQDAESVTLIGQSGIRIEKAHPSSDGYTRVRFYKEGSILYRKGEPNEIDRILAQNVSGFEVSSGEVSSDIYTIRLTLLDAEGASHQIRMDVYPMNLEGVSSKSFYNNAESAGDWAFLISSY